MLSAQILPSMQNVTCDGNVYVVTELDTIFRKNVLYSPKYWNILTPGHISPKI